VRKGQKVVAKSEAAKGGRVRGRCEERLGMGLGGWEVEVGLCVVGGRLVG
jgi:hypothetical protein